MQMFEGWCASEVLRSAISLEIRDGDPCSSRDARVIDVLESMEAPEDGHIGIRSSPWVVGSVAQVECVCTNARSTGDREEELEAIVQLEKYDTVAITET